SRRVRLCRLSARRLQRRPRTPGNPPAMHRHSRTPSKRVRRQARELPQISSWRLLHLACPDGRCYAAEVVESCERMFASLVDSENAESLGVIAFARPTSSPETREGRVGCTYSIFLQIERIWYAAEFVHPTRSDSSFPAKDPSRGESPRWPR